MLSFIEMIIIILMIKVKNKIIIWVYIENMGLFLVKIKFDL